MREYLSPGVYVAEVAMEPKSIEGVSTSTAGLLGQNLVNELHRLLDRVSVSDASEKNDLTVALLELLAWQADTLSRHAEKLAKESYLPTKRLFTAALALLVNTDQQTDSAGSTRIRFFAGRLLDQADLNVEEIDSATKGKSRFGFGILSGLEVNVNQQGISPSIEVSPGCALDKRGRKIVLKKCIKQKLPVARKRVFVIARPKGRASLSIAVIPTIEGRVVLAGKLKRDDILLKALEKTSRGWKLVRSPT